MSLKDFLKDALQLGKDGVFKVDVKDSFSFFNTENSETDKVLNAFNDFEYQGRKINVEVTKNSNSGGGKGGRRRKSRRDDSFGKSDSKSGNKGRSRFRDDKDGGFKGKKGKRSGSRGKNIESSIKRRKSKK